MAKKTTRAKDRREEKDEDEDEWLECKSFSVDPFDSDYKSFTMDINLNLDTEAHVVTANATQDLVRQVFGVLAEIWPNTNFQFQRDAKKRLTKIQTAKTKGS